MPSNPFPCAGPHLSKAAAAQDHRRARRCRRGDDLLRPQLPGCPVLADGPADRQTGMHEQMARQTDRQTWRTARSPGNRGASDGIRTVPPGPNTLTCSMPQCKMVCSLQSKHGPSVRLPVSPSARLSVCLFVCLSVCPAACLHIPPTRTRGMPAIVMPWSWDDDRSNTAPASSEWSLNSCAWLTSSRESVLLLQSAKYIIAATVSAHERFHWHRSWHSWLLPPFGSQRQRSGGVDAKLTI
jgi:hypothetical protein